jgi:hypothetical protein
MRKSYATPQMYAESFVANQYIAACKEPIYNVEPTQVRCETPGHQNTQYNTMFLDSQTACVVKFNPGVGTAEGDMLKGVTDRIGMELCESIKGNMLALGGLMMVHSSCMTQLLT